MYMYCTGEFFYEQYRILSLDAPYGASKQFHHPTIVVHLQFLFLTTHPACTRAQRVDGRLRQFECPRSFRNASFTSRRISFFAIRQLQNNQTIYCPLWPRGPATNPSCLRKTFGCFTRTNIPNVEAVGWTVVPFWKLFCHRRWKSDNQNSRRRWKSPEGDFFPGALQPRAQATEPAYAHDRVTPLNGVLKFRGPYPTTDQPLIRNLKKAPPWRRKLERFYSLKMVVGAHIPANSLLGIMSMICGRQSMMRGCFHEKCTLPRIQYGTQEYAIINKFCDFTILHDKDTKYVRIYMKNIINCCSGESYVSCDHVMVRGLKRYAVQVVEVLLIKKLHFFS